MPEATITNRFHAVSPPRTTSSTHNAHHNKATNASLTIFEPLIFIFSLISYKFNEKFGHLMRIWGEKSLWIFHPSFLSTITQAPNRLNSLLRNG